jgi:hypothetical protein
MRTHSSHAHAHREKWRVAILLVVALGLLAAAAPAAAAPPQTLGLDALQAELTAQGSVDGYMRTALAGTTPQDIPVRILAIVDGFYWGKLIMFESTDQAITDIGGIAAGMSGSPVYAAVDGPDPIVGAVSYGDSFTLHGTGLATPIEYMTALQHQYGSATAAPEPATTVRLDEPVVTASGVVRKLVLGGEKAAASAAAGTSVVHPLAEAVITGLSSGSNAYRRLATKLEDGGLLVLSGDGAGAPAATPALEAGSPCGVTFSTGRYALTVLGTVTYADGDDVLLFGHPILGGYASLDLGLGQIEGTLTGATVNAVWPSAISPYKMMTPADAKGVAVQDRSAGVLARLGGAVPDFPVSTHTSFEGGAVVDDVTDLGHWFAVGYWPELISFWEQSPGITSFVAAAGLSHGLDSDPLVGSAVTTTTVVVSDGAQDYTFVRDNIWDNVGDETGTGLAETAIGDVTTIMANVLYDPFDVREVRIESVDVVADFSTARRHGAITDLGVARALRWGQNQVDVTFYHTGSTDPRTLSAILDVPEGTDLSGSVVAVSAAAWSEYYGEASGSEGSTGGPLTLAETKAVVDGIPTNADVVVAYIPDSSGEESDYSFGPEPAAETIVPSDWVVDGGVEKATAVVQAGGSGTVPYQGAIRVSGYVRRTADDAVVIYCREAGKPEPVEPVAVVPAVLEDGMATFGAVLPGFRHNVLVTAEVGALDEASLPGADQFLVKVRARTRLSVSRAGDRLLLTARVAPADTTGGVTFQRLVRGRWVSAGSAQLDHGAAAVKTRRAAKVRARFTGGSMNAASGWVTATVR